MRGGVRTGPVPFPTTGPRVLEVGKGCRYGCSLAPRPQLQYETRDAVQGLLPALQVPRPQRGSRGRQRKEDGWRKARGKAGEWDMNDGGEKKGGGD